MKALNDFLVMHHRCDDNLRIGQRFVSWYVKDPWPELYYETSVERAVEIIGAWLRDMHYTYSLPKRIKYPGYAVRSMRC